VAEDRVNRRLAAILCGDVASYSRLMGDDEEGTLAALKAHRRELIDPLLTQHQGRIVKTTGDGILIEFASVIDAVRCAVVIQQGMEDRNANVALNQRILFRVGINLGDIIIEDGDIFGDGVNVAARLEALAQPGEIYVSASVREQLGEKLPLAFADMGEYNVKNIARPIHAYRVEKRGEPSVSVAANVEKRSLALPDRPSIAALPFQNMSGDAEQDYFCDGMVEDIITGLSRIKWLFVIARNSSFIYKDRAVDVKQIGRELGVRYVLEGSVRKGGNRVRITAQLNDVATGSHIWAERYDRGLADVFAVQDEITEAIVAAIEPQLYATESFRAQRKPPDSMDAWDLVMRALSHYWRVTRQDNVVAQELLEKAIAIDPNYGQALGVLAASRTFSAHMGWADRAATLPNAKCAALAAIRADSEDPWAHHALGCVYLFTRHFDDSLAEFELALRLNPNFSLAQGYYGLALSYCGRWEEGDQAVRRALRLSPRDPSSAVYTGIAAYAQFIGRNYDEAMRLAREAIRQRGDFVGAHRVFTAAAGMAGEAKVAATALRELRRVQPNISLAWIMDQMPIKQDADREHYMEAFRRAGLD
jgi:TolB-like protein/class 3 adenylate cyclase/cytochrome c-type biogenesis protein CcmH/NrfG